MAALVSFMFLIMQHTCYDVSLAAHLSPHSVTTVRGTFHWFHLWVYAMFIFYGVNVGLQITWCVYRGRVWRNAEETSASTSPQSLFGSLGVRSLVDSAFGNWSIFRCCA